ncbi:TonB-dependent receptor plug domain-containing protein [Hyalangium rubrum]|uniref:TonB-dependent receptor n=1 Tax=Hyalangium rubrum TaxID=3103134 RepID=A0ABU5H422_9BACT|nr:TonB-dependent receptor [Hyalangium sp. s54d21]MDY7227563.1 TonB-dependent receptor [Hyalangium sp. s54d21]
MGRSFLAAPGLCLALMMGGLARAEEAPAPEGEVFTVPTVEVRETAAPEPPDAASQRDPSGALTVIETADFGGAAKDAAEVLSTSAGVVVQDSGGYGQSKNLVVRGASSNGTLVLLDGIPLNGAGGIADLSRVPLALVERFEVLRGGVGARYGSGGLGGVVNVITRRPDAAARVAGEATYGSWDTALGWLSATGPVLGGEGLVLLHGGRSSGDFPFLFDTSPALPGDALEERRRTNNDARGAGGMLRLRHPLGEHFEVDVLGELSLDERGLAGTATNPIPDARQGNGRGSASVRLMGELGSVRGSARAWFRRDRLSLSNGPQALQGTQAQRVGGVELEARTLLGGWHGVSAVLTVSGEDVSGVEEATVGTTRPSRGQASIMVMDELVLAGGRLLLAPSLRVERAGSYTLLSPKVGATLTLPAGLELRANAGQSHRAPSFLELYIRQGLLLPNAALRPERVLYADVAVVHRTERSLASVGGFYSLYEDLIAYELFPPFAAKPYNFAAASVAGLEAEGEWRPYPWVAGALSYTLLVSRNLRDDPRYYLKELPYRPRHKLSARMSGGPRWLTGRVEVMAQSVQYVNRTEEAELPGRTFVHAGLSSSFGRAPELTLSVELKNVFDAHAEDLDGYPLPGRSAYVTLAAAFGGPPPTPPKPRTDSP